MTTTRRTARLACISFLVVGLVAGLVVAFGQQPAPPAAAVAIVDEPLPPPQTPFRRFVSDFMESPLAVASLIVFAITVLIAVLAGNDQAQAFYERRGMRPTVTYLMRLGGDV